MGGRTEKGVRGQCRVREANGRVRLKGNKVCEEVQERQKRENTKGDGV